MIQRPRSLDACGKSMWLTLHTGTPTFWNMFELPPAEVPTSTWIEVKPERLWRRTYRNLQPVVVAQKVRRETERANGFALWRTKEPTCLEDMLFDGELTSWRRTLSRGSSAVFDAGALRLTINPFQVCQ